MIAEYLEHALQFERLAAGEQDPSLKVNLKSRLGLTASWRESEQKSSRQTNRNLQTETLLLRKAPARKPPQPAGDARQIVYPLGVGTERGLPHVGVWKIISNLKASLLVQRMSDSTE